MARLDDLVSQVSDTALRAQLEDAVSELKRRQRFGLVFEEHQPEITSLNGLPVQVDSMVQRRDEASARGYYRVKGIDKSGVANLDPVGAGEPTSLHVSKLIVVKQFGDPVYPVLTSVGAVHRGADDKPHHAVINGENFHALQLMLYLYEGQVDCIYIDPPYNTGAKDWKYNNRYVDKTDSWRHSKWLSMMERRLRISKRLLRNDGVLIVTIDENEEHHLGMLLERLFPDYLRYSVTIVINPKGREKSNFAPVDERAFFAVPDVGYDIIQRATATSPTAQDSLFDYDIEMDDENPESSDILETEEDEDQDDDSSTRMVAEAESTNDIEWEWRHARRRGGGAERSSYREKRPNQFYPIYIDQVNRKVVRVGSSVPLEDTPSFEWQDGLRPIWPIDREGNHRCWAFIPSSMQSLIDSGRVVLGKHNRKTDDWTIKYCVPRKFSKKLKTVWWEKIYDAGTHGTQLVNNILGKRGAFPFPKSVYAVRDCLAAVVSSRPNALIVDFFAGSGTTLHATCLLNAVDGHSRRCVLVTNNEVEESMVARLAKQGHFRGDRAFEQHGIFEEVTKPRCEAVVTGMRPSGTRIPGRYVNRRTLADGFPECVEFYRLDYLDPDEVELGRQFEAILPSLWLAAGGIGPREIPKPGSAYSMPKGSTYGVLFKESGFRGFLEQLEKRTEVTHV